ncbi:hypothetical protein Tco_0522437 [Tanacetum coccineum]
MKEGDGDITTWEEFVMKIFKISRMHLIFMCLDSMIKSACDTKTAQRRDDGEVRDPLEFIPWRNSKFKDHKKVDETTKRALLHTWIEIGNEEGLLNDEVSSDKEWKEHEYKNPPNDSFPKPYLNINNEKDKNNHNENNKDADKLSGMNLSGAPHSEKINNQQPNKGVCRVDKFKVIKYTIGDNKEFLAICTRKCDSWAQTVNGVSSIYHDIFRKKDEGWTVHRTK